MQRSAATAKPSSHSGSPSAKSPGVSGRSTPRSTNGAPSSKRVRLSSGEAAPGHTPDEAEILARALEEEERKKEEAIQRAAEKAGETKWELSFYEGGVRAPQNAGLRVEYAGFAVIDGEESEDEDEGEVPVRTGRVQFGGGLNKKGQTKKVYKDGEDEEEGEISSDDSDASSEDGETDSSEEGEYDPAAELIRETKRDMKNEARAEKKTLHKEKRVETPRRNLIVDEDASLSGLTSLSGGGGSVGRNTSKMECYNCGKKGHTRADCPERKSSGGRPGGFGRGRGGGRGGGGGFGGGNQKASGFVRF